MVPRTPFFSLASTLQLCSHGLDVSGPGQGQSTARLKRVNIECIGYGGKFHMRDNDTEVKWLMQSRIKDEDDP